MSFKFELDSKVQIAINTSESGAVIARAEYQGGENMYRVRYVNGQGYTTEKWWDESALEHKTY